MTGSLAESATILITWAAYSIQPYCTIVQNQIIAAKGYGASARVSVNFRKFSPWMARARRLRAGLTALPPMRDFASLILGKYCTFVCGTLFRGIKLTELYYPPKLSST